LPPEFPDRHCKTLWGLIRDNPGLFAGEIAERVKKVSPAKAFSSRKTVGDHLFHLIKAGLVETVDGKHPVTGRMHPRYFISGRSIPLPETFSQMPKLLIQKLHLQTKYIENDKVHYLWLKELVNQSSEPINSHLTFFSTYLPHTWEELNPQIYILLNGKKSKKMPCEVTLIEDNPHLHRFVAKFPHPIYLSPAEVVRFVCEYDVKVRSQEADYSRYSRIFETGIREIVYDLMADDKKLTIVAFSYNSSTGKQDYIPIKAEKRRITDLSTNSRTQAVHWEMYREKPGLELIQFELR
jgi:hypothetical protein